MNRKTVFGIWLCVLGAMLCSCEKHEVIFDHPFIYITDNSTNTTSSAEVDSEGSFETTYAVILSSRTLESELLVNYDLEPGNGLQEGVDYELLSPKQLVFPVGLYVNVIHIRWLPRRVDDSVDAGGRPVKDNSVKIVLKSNSMNFTMGYPGPDKLNSYSTSTKVNM